LPRLYIRKIAYAWQRSLGNSGLTAAGRPWSDSRLSPLGPCRRARAIVNIAEDGLGREVTQAVAPSTALGRGGWRRSDCP
jgi:hypothetical protein